MGIFNGLFDSANQQVITPQDFIVCVLVSLITGVFLAFLYTIKNKYSKSFLVTLAILPATVCVVIMMVNGNVGAGVAVAGAFSLVRFRSAPGTAREIGTIFLAMVTGIIAGMGYLAYSVLFAVIIGAMMTLFNLTSFGERKVTEREKILRITIPEDLDYVDVFDDILKKYTSAYEVVSVKTTNMGSMFKLTYNITLNNIADEKSFIDELRCRNGNLEISVSRQELKNGEL